jgi:hypothetical protein
MCTSVQPTGGLMRCTLIAGFAVSFLFACHSHAHEMVASEMTPGTPPEIEILSSSENGLRLVFSLRDLVVEDVRSGGEDFQLPLIPGGGLEGETGEPALPTFSRFLAVPAGANVRVSVSPLEEERRAGFRALPVRDENAEAIPLRRETKRTAPSPGTELVSVGEAALLRDLRVVPLTFRPVQHDAQRDELRIVRRMEVEIDFRAGEALPSPDESEPTIPASFDRLYRQLVLNYPDALPAGRVAPGKYLVICPNISGVVDTLQALLDWRQRQGFDVQLATTAETGSTKEQIKSFIQGIYDDPETLLEYVVLIGDATGTVMLPTWIETVSGYQGEGDLPYSQLAGGDVLPDVHLGRLSVDTETTLGRVVQKIVNYEITPYTAEPDWFVRSCIVGDPEPSEVSCIDAGRWLATRLQEIGFVEADTIFVAPWVSQMVAGLNRGDTIFGYRGIYGMSGWSNARTYMLTNGWKMPFVVTLTCDTGSFASGTSYTEAFLRTWDDTNAQPRGGIGAIGLSTIGTHTRYNNCLYFGIFRGLIQERLLTMGAALSRGCLEMYLNYNMAQPLTVQKWCHWANLMGDPAVDVWTAYPAALDVTHPTSLAIGENSVLVSVSESGSPVDSVQVCLWKEDDGLHVVGLTDAFGEVELPVDDASAGELLLTVTKHDKHAYLATISVAAENLYVGYASSLIDDDTSGESSGNGDGVVNPGETIELPVQLENFGTQTAAGVTAVLSTDDEYVVLGDTFESFGSLSGGTTAWGDDDFDFTLAAGCPDGHVIVFSLEVTAGVEEWHSIIELPVTSAALVAQSATVHDGGNARLDPGETADVSVVLHNEGGAAATGVTATLVSESSYVTVIDGSGSFGTIQADSTGDNTADRFTVSVDAETYEGYLASFQLLMTFSGGITDTTQWTLTVGSRASDDPVGPDRRGYLAYDDTDTAYPEAPTYSWIEIDPAYGGDGTEIVIGDTDKYLDKSTVVSLPFPFVYYGQSFAEATVCSNGWLAMGSTPLFTYQNWTIPGAGGPNGMLAAFWDDLYEGTGSKVLQKYDATNHRWILEWSRMLNDIGNYTETFELVLYDPAHHPTDTGDGLIVYQYETVTVTDPINGYVTVGIESPDQLDGVLCTYFNRYSEGAAILEAGRAIKFVPTMEGPAGNLNGEVLNASFGDDPIPYAQVRVLGAGRVFNTTSEGSYSGVLSPGSYTVVASHEGFVPDTASAVVINAEQTTVVDFHLTDIAPPAITTTEHSWTSDTTGPYPIPVTIVEYSQLSEQVLYYSVDGGGFMPLALEPQGGDEFRAEIPGQPLTTIVHYYTYARDVVGLEAYDPPAGPVAPYAFVVAPQDTIFQDDFETDQGWIIGAPGDGAIAGIWVREEPVGTEYGGYPIQPEYDHSPDPGEICFVTENGEPGGPAGDSDVDGGKTTLFSPLFDLSQRVGVTLSYWVWYSDDRGDNPAQDPWIVKVTSNGDDWITLEDTMQSTGESWVRRSFLLDDYVELSDQIQFRFVARDQPYASLVEAALDDVLLTGILDAFTGVGEGPDVVVRENGLDPCRPNPFRLQTRVSFRLVQPGVVNLSIYDVAGRRVATLVEGRTEAGEHHVLWEGRNAAGKKVAAGVYFVRLDVPGFTQVQRTTLLR